MTELDELERDLLQAADTWFNVPLHQKLTRLIQIARMGETRTPYLGPGITGPVDVDLTPRTTFDHSV